MNLNKLRRLFPNSSESFLKQNADLHDLDSLPAAEPKPDGRRQCATKNPTQVRCSFRLVISLVGFRRTPLDDDNFSGACKHIRDSISKSIGLDDGDKRIRWQYQQLQTTGEEGVLVRIELKLTA